MNKDSLSWKLSGIRLKNSIILKLEVNLLLKIFSLLAIKIRIKIINRLNKITVFKIL